MADQAGSPTDQTFDLVVVGGGVAGWTAARRAQQLGLNVVVLEKHTAGPGWGNGRLSGGWYHAAYRSPRRPPDELYERILTISEGYSRPDLARAWADNVARALDFLISEGGEFAPLGPGEVQGNVAQPPRLPALGRDWKGKGPDRLLSGMWSTFLAADGSFRGGRRAVELAVEGGRVVGVVADTGARRETYRGRAVALCDGGFQGNADLVARFITNEYKLRGSVSDTGDALLMGLGAGAKAVNMEWFYGHCLSRDALRNDSLWPTLGVGELVAAGALVDGNGERFVDEGLGDEIAADRISKSGAPGGCWVVFDDVVWETTGREGGDFALNPGLIEQGAAVLTTMSLESLADGAGLPARKLVETVRRFNATFGGGHEIDPPRTSESALPIQQPPFHAVPVIAGITFAMGGLLVNQHGQVLDESENPIPGLYAAGGAMGGLQGGPGFGYAGGWSEAATFGLLVAEHAATQAR